MKHTIIAALAVATAFAAAADDKSHHNTTVTPTAAPSVNVSADSHPVTTSAAAGGDASNALSVEGDRALALATGAPIPAACPPGLVPGKGLKRGIGGLFGAWSMSGTCQAPTDAERSAIDAQRAHELALVRAQAEALKAQADADRAAAERARVTMECDRCAASK